MAAAIFQLLAWGIIGGLAGGLACRMMSISVRRKIAMHIALGVGGAMLAGGLVSSLVEAGPVQTGPSLASLIAALAGAIALLAIAGRLRSGVLRA